MDDSALNTQNTNVRDARVRQRWGHTEAYAEYTNKTENRSRQAQAAIAEGLMRIFSDFGHCKETAPACASAQALVQRLQAYITEHYYRCTPEILNALGTLYTEDPAFTKTIDEAGGKGTAEFASRAIAVYCKEQLHKKALRKDSQ